MEKHHHRTILAACILPIYVDEVVVWRHPPLTLLGQCRPRAPARIQSRPNGLGVTAWQPCWGPVMHGRQCSTVGLIPTSAESLGVPGLAWCATMRQPCGIFWYTLVAITKACFAP